MRRTQHGIGQGLAEARAARPIVPGERIHVVGVAGAGASAAALLADAAGAQVSGCDPGAPTPYSAPLEALSISVAHEHDAEHVQNKATAPARLAVTKALTALQPDHPELRAAREAGIPVEAWQQVVADAAASQGGRLVAVAGTHGKSTSAGWLVHLLVESGRDPAAFVGALLPAERSGALPATARWGRGHVFILEADEYAGNFDPYRPSIALVLNAEWDHPDVFADRAAVIDAFEEWLRLPGGDERQAVINIADGGGRELAARLTAWGPRVISLGARDPVDDDAKVRYSLVDEVLSLEGLPGLSPSPLEARLQLAGEHNAANAAAVATVAALLGLSGSEISAGLSSFEGVGRRLEFKGEPGGVLIIDDYGHHPSAIRATIAAIRGRHPDRRLWVAHEPLTYHRAAAMLDELAGALADADRVVIADIWPGRDHDTTITSSAALAQAVSSLVGVEVAAPGSVESTADYLVDRVAPGDVVLVMGGGRSYVIADRLVVLLGEGSAE
ncbi:MAG: glutamate ligase domain-containing protein [Chloroflexota bacterium]